MREFNLEAETLRQTQLIRKSGKREEAASEKITGAEAAIGVAGRDCVRLTQGRDCYHPETRTVFLSEATWHGADAGSIYRALHEAGHARQHAERPLWFSLRNVRLFRRWIEWDAWRRADVWMRGLGWEPGECGALRRMREECLRSYGGGAR